MRLVAATAVVAAATFAAAGSASASVFSVQVGCIPRWHVMASPNAGGARTHNDLSGVAAVSPRNALAVGSFTAANGDDRPLVLRLVRNTWRRLFPSLAGLGDSQLLAVDGVLTPAGGVYFAGGLAGARSFVLRYAAARNRFVRVATPNLGAGSEIVTDVLTLSATDVWVVGVRARGATTFPFVLHLRGSRFANVPLPGVGNGALFGVSGDSADHVMFFGSRLDSSGEPTTLALHWDGASVAVVPSANPGAGGSFFLGGLKYGNTGIGVGGRVSRDDVVRSLAQRHVCARHDPCPMRERPTPNIGSLNNTLEDVATSVVGGRRVIVAVGTGEAATDRFRQLVARSGDGGVSWTRMASPPLPGRSWGLGGITDVPGTSQFIAVGDRETRAGVHRTLIEHYACGCGA
jgi:hypothetical protein